MSNTTHATHVVWQQIKKIGPLGVLILLHLAFFYALQNGLMHRLANVPPQEVIATFISPEPKSVPTPAPPKTQPTPPKVVSLIKRPLAPTPIPVTQAASAISAPPQSAPVTEAAPASEAPPTQAAAAPPGPPLPKQITSDIEYIEAPAAKYPPASRRMGEEGTIQFRVLVNALGKAEKVDFIKRSDFPRLDEEARRAMLRAVFKPYIDNGQPITVSATASISFTLNH